MHRRNRNVDVFGGILEASDDELEAAGIVRHHEDILNDQLAPGSSRKPSKRARSSTANGAENNASTSRRATTKRSEFPADGSYITEDGTPLMHEREVLENSLQPPLRTLHDFFLFEPETRSLVSMTTLWEGAGACEAFGNVLPYIDPLTESDDYNAQDKIPFKTSAILRLLPDVFRHEIMVQTEYAMYVLATPAPFYRELYLPFYKKEMLLRLILRQIYDDPDSSEAEFFENLEDIEDPILGRAWMPNDIGPETKYTKEELKKTLERGSDIDWGYICDTPLLRTITTITANHDSNQRSHPQAVPPRQTRIPQVFPKRKKTKVPLCWETTVTPFVHNLIYKHMDNAFKVVGEWPPALRKKFFLRGRPPRSPLPRNYIPVAGDFVLIDENLNDELKSDSDSNADSDHDDSEYLIAQIINVYSNKFHARLFVHGSETLLERFAHGQELFLSVADPCRELTAEMIVAKYEVVRITLRELSEQKWPNRNTYFYCAAWDRKNPAGFVEVTDEQVAINECYECIRSGERISEMTEYGALVRNVEYHPHDFISYKVKDGIVCAFGQINRILRSPDSDDILFEIFQIGRVKDRSGPGDFTDMELFITSTIKILPAVDVLGHVRILHTTHYRQRLTLDPRWIFNNPFIFHMKLKASNLQGTLSPLTEEQFRSCDICTEKASARDFSWPVCREERVLRALDPYIGAAGFGAGLAEGCSMKTVFGVDNNPSAAETARRNLSSDATILTNDACRVLAKLVERKLDAGEIDLVYSGPPCQNDSALNRHKTDPTRPLFTTISYVDLFRPDFFVMECVVGFLARKIVKKGKEKKEVEEEKAGELKLALKVLHFLGYNVSGRILYALAYGVPQTRARFFMVATNPSYGPFKFPEPTHGFRTRRGQKDPLSQLLPQPSRRRKFNDTMSTSIDMGLGTGLLETATVEETLCDLPYFDWKTPNFRDTTDRPRRQMQEVVVGPSKAIWGIYDSKFAYTKRCTNSYQYRLRFGIGAKLQPVYQHYTKRFIRDKVVNIMNLPIVDGADYRHLEQQNLEWGLRDPASSKAIAGHRGGAYRRLVSKGYFDTIVTNVGPNAKQAKIIHPFCKRILTVREYARAQGFPDSFSFYSEDNKPDDYLKQIGNSVPFGVSAAIGRAIQELVFEKWLKDNDDQ